jgi:hypothetical protein
MRGIYILSLALPTAALGWWGLYELTRRFGPDDSGALYLFFALLFLAITATAAPLAAYLNQRFAPTSYPRDPWRVLRHSAWLGLCLASWAWLQTQRAFNPAFAVIIAMILVSFEILIVRLKGR